MAGRKNHGQDTEGGDTTPPQGPRVERLAGGGLRITDRHGNVHTMGRQGGGSGSPVTRNSHPAESGYAAGYHPSSRRLIEPVGGSVRVVRPRIATAPLLPPDPEALPPSVIHAGAMEAEKILTAKLWVPLAAGLVLSLMLNVYLLKGWTTSEEMKAQEARYLRELQTTAEADKDLLYRHLGTSRTLESRSATQVALKKAALEDQAKVEGDLKVQIELLEKKLKSLPPEDSKPTLSPAPR